MDFITQLWLPIVVSAVLVFLASSVIHMLFKWHNPDYRKLANEDQVRDAIRAATPAPGLYVVPHCLEMKDLGTPEMQKKFTDGPVAFLTVRASGLPSMGPQLIQWFVFTLAVAVICAYLASRTLPPTASWGQVMRVVATTAFLTYAGGCVTNGIWMGKPWISVAKECLDALIYAALTGGAFAYLWR